MAPPAVTSRHPLTREQELREAIEKARLPAREYRIYRALFARAEWKSAVIKRQFQPRSLTELAALAQMSKSSVAAGLGHLQRHGWVLRHRQVVGAGIGGRGHGTRYELARGTDCDCPGLVRGEPKSDAVRARQYRARKREAPPVKGPGPGQFTEAKGSRIHVIKGPGVRDESAGETPNLAKEVRDEGKVVEEEGYRVPVAVADPDEARLTACAFPSIGDWPPGSNGEEANRVRGRRAAA